MLRDSFDFDTLYNRRLPGDIKYQIDKEHKDVIPMWITDMDFKSPDAVRIALENAVKHGIWGYMSTDEQYDEAVISWYQKSQKWTICPEHILKTPGVMFGIASAIQALTKPSDAILIFQPVYHPFSKIIKGNGRRLVVSELRYSEEKYQIEYDDFENKIVSENVKMIIFCSPHNPVSRVWTKDELLKVGEICLKHKVWIVSDEIHSDFVYPGHQHIPIASLSDELAENCATCTAPTKTFNLAGLQAANIVVKNRDARRKIYKAGLATGYSSLNTMAITATKAAYMYGETWLNALLSYLSRNITLVRDCCACSKGKMKLVEPEGTYLLWIDFRGLGMKETELEDLLLNKASVRLYKGSIFGTCGDGFMRMNIATPKSQLQSALSRISDHIQMC